MEGNFFTLHLISFTPGMINTRIQLAFVTIPFQSSNSFKPYQRHSECNCQPCAPVSPRLGEEKVTHMHVTEPIINLCEGSVMRDILIDLDFPREIIWNRNEIRPRSKTLLFRKQTFDKAWNLCPAFDTSKRGSAPGPACHLHAQMVSSTVRRRQNDHAYQLEAICAVNV